MSENAEAASGVVSMVTELQGRIMRVSADIAGDLSRDVLKMMFLIISNNNKTKQQKEIYDMMMSKEGTKTIEIRAEGAKQFDDLAKKEGLAYNAVEDIGAGAIRLIFKISDIEKANRVLEQMPATVKLMGDAVARNVTITEQALDEYQRESMGLYSSGFDMGRSGVDVSKGRDAQMPQKFVETQLAGMNGQENSVNFSIPASSRDPGPRYSTDASTGQRTAQDPRERPEGITSVHEMFGDGKISVFDDIFEPADTHDLANNDLAVGVPGIDINQSVGRDR